MREKDREWEKERKTEREKRTEREKERERGRERRRGRGRENSKSNGRLRGNTNKYLKPPITNFTLHSKNRKMFIRSRRRIKLTNTALSSIVLDKEPDFSVNKLLSVTWLIISVISIAIQLPA